MRGWEGVKTGKTTMEKRKGEETRQKFGRKKPEKMGESGDKENLNGD